MHNSSSVARRRKWKQPFYLRLPVCRNTNQIYTHREESTTKSSSIRVTTTTTTTYDNYSSSISSSYPATPNTNNASSHYLLQDGLALLGRPALVPFGRLVCVRHVCFFVFASNVHRGCRTVATEASNGKGEQGRFTRARERERDVKGGGVQHFSCFLLQDRSQLNLVVRFPEVTDEQLTEKAFWEQHGRMLMGRPSWPVSCFPDESHEGGRHPSSVSGPGDAGGGCTPPSSAGEAAVLLGTGGGASTPARLELRALQGRGSGEFHKAGR